MRQIALSEACVSYAFALSRNRSVGVLLGAGRMLHRHASLDSLLAILERGYRALVGVGEIGPFLAAMRAGETAYLDRIYAQGAGRDG